MRLFGYHPEQLVRDRIEGYDFALQAVCCIADYKDDPTLTYFLASQMPPEWLCRFGETEYPTDEATNRMRERIAEQIVELTELVESFKAIDDASRDAAPVRALAPLDTPRNRLLVRYMRSTESSFDRSIKTLGKLQSERRKALETALKTAGREGSNGGSRNEADFVGRSRSKRIHPGSCVKLNGLDFEVGEVSDGNIYLMPACGAVDSSDLKVVSMPATGV